MKEGYPQKEPAQEKIRRLVSHFGCKPESIRTLRKAETGKLFVIVEAEKENVPKVIKATGVGINVARLQTESNVLSLAPRDYLEKNGVLIPELEQELTKYDGFYAIMISKMPKGRKPSFEDFCHVLEVFRQMELPDGLNIKRMEPEDYLRKTLIRLDALRNIGALKGLTRNEIERVKKFYQDNVEFLKLFDQVFVHGDFKKKHTRRIDDKLGVIDFDKSVIGSELEDWTWLSVRHPNLMLKIIKHLKNQFRGEKLENFDTAFRLMQIDRTIEAYFTRTYQWRGNLDAFSYVSKAWGRAILNILLSP